MNNIYWKREFIYITPMEYDEITPNNYFFYKYNIYFY